MSKGQTEIIGIVVVVVLLVFLLLFFIGFSDNKVEVGNFETVFASNSLSVILDYVPVYSCDEKNIGDLLKDCKFECSEGEDYQNACSCPCEFSEGKIVEILGKLVEEGGFRGYYFNVGGRSSTDLIDLDEGKCEEGVGIYGPRYFVSSYEFKLKLCK